MGVPNEFETACKMNAKEGRAEQKNTVLTQEPTTLDLRTTMLEEWVMAATPSKTLRQALGAGREGADLRTHGARLTVATERGKAPHAILRVVNNPNEVKDALEMDLMTCTDGAVLSYLGNRCDTHSIEAAINQALQGRDDVWVHPHRIELGNGTSICAGSVLAWTSSLAVTHWIDALARYGALRMERAARELIRTTQPPKASTGDDR